MRYLGFWLLASFGLFLAACVETTAPPPAPSCQVSYVVDGDTLHLTCDGALHKVRLLGYDTPEVYHPLCPAEKRAGEAATDLMRALVASGPVSGVRFAGHDRYGRDLADVQIAGQDVAAHMLGSNLARPYAGHKHPDWCRILGS
ncbi:MAG: thermonuclease family protein [Cypionkella sp.]